MSWLTRLIGLSLVTLFGVVCLMAPSASAVFVDPFDEACSDPNTSVDSSVCADSFQNYDKTPAQLRDDYIIKIANIIAAVGGIIAVVLVMVNGVTLLTSSGDSAKVNKARDGLIYAAVGIVIIVMARSIVAFIMRFI